MVIVLKAKNDIHWISPLSELSKHDLAVFHLANMLYPQKVDAY